MTFYFEFDSFRSKDSKMLLKSFELCASPETSHSSLDTSITVFKEFD